MIIVSIDFGDVIPSFPLYLMISLRSCVKLLKECFNRYLNTSKSIKKNWLLLIFSTYFSKFGNQSVQNADCRLGTLYKMQTADCRPGIKCKLRPKLSINADCWRATFLAYPSVTQSPFRVYWFLLGAKRQH